MVGLKRLSRAASVPQQYRQVLVAYLCRRRYWVLGDGWEACALILASNSASWGRGASAKYCVAAAETVAAPPNATLKKQCRWPVSRTVIW